MSIVGRAIKYGYSNTREKAMEARLLNVETLKRIESAKDMSEVLGILYETDYKTNLVEFGGVSAKAELIDFAISKNLADKLEKLVEITPKDEQDLIRPLIAKWDLANVKLAIEAKIKGNSYDSIAKYIIDKSPFGSEVIKQAVDKQSVEELIDFLYSKSPRDYANILKNAKEAYAEDKTGLKAVDAIDLGAISQVAKAVELLKARKHFRSSKIAQLTIDMQNLVTAIRAKSNNMSFEKIRDLLVENGSIEKSQIERAYSAQSLDKMLEALGYKGLGNAGLTGVEIAIRRRMLETGRKLVKGVVLSFTTLVYYIYLKELEVMNLRLVIKSKQYGISMEEIEKLGFAQVE